MLGRDDEAEKDFERMLELSPRWREPLAGLIDAALARR